MRSCKIKLSNTSKTTLKFDYKVQRWFDQSPAYMCISASDEGLITD